MFHGFEKQNILCCRMLISRALSMAEAFDGSCMRL